MRNLFGALTLRQGALESASKVEKVPLGAARVAKVAKKEPRDKMEAKWSLKSNFFKKV